MIKTQYGGEEWPKNEYFIFEKKIRKENKPKTISFWKKIMKTNPKLVHFRKRRSGKQTKNYSGVDSENREVVAEERCNCEAENFELEWVWMVFEWVWLNWDFTNDQHDEKFTHLYHHGTESIHRWFNIPKVSVWKCNTPRVWKYKVAKVVRAWYSGCLSGNFLLCILVIMVKSVIMLSK